MPAPKIVPKEKILNAAFRIVRRGGMSALNARSLSKELGCSTRPIYLSFGGMDEVKAAVMGKIDRTWCERLEREVKAGKYPEYKTYGMGYVKFAREERELFKCLFMSSRDERLRLGGNTEAVLQSLQTAAGIDRSTAERFHFESWVFVHGIATMIATGYLDLDEDTVSALITDMFTGLKARFIGGN